MLVNGNNSEQSGILKAAGSIISTAKTTDNRDCLKDIYEFIVNVLERAGFDLKMDAGSDGNAAIREGKIFMDWFDRIGQKTVSPGDLVSYMDSEDRETIGLIESYDPETTTGKMYAMDDSKGEVSSVEFTEADIEGANFLRPKMDFFTGNLAGLFAGTDEDYDEDRYMGPAYPSPKPK